MGGADSLTLFSAESPRDLAVDKEGKKLFWTDTKLKKIEYGDLTGRVSFVCYTLVTLSLCDASFRMLFYFWLGSSVEDVRIIVMKFDFHS